MGYATSDATGYGAQFSFRNESNLCSPRPKYFSQRRGSNGGRLCALDIFRETIRANALKLGFLSNLVKIFPSLATRPLYLMGESYAGTYIVRIIIIRTRTCLMRHHQPYITKTIFSKANPPVTLRKIAVGDGALGSNAVFEQLPTVTIPVLFTSVVRQR